MLQYVRTYSVFVCRLLNFPHGQFLTSEEVHEHEWHTHTFIPVLQTFIGVVSKVLNISNEQSPGQEERKRRQGKEDPGTSLLITLDKFALQSFNASLGLVMNDNLSKLTYV